MKSLGLVLLLAGVAWGTPVGFNPGDGDGVHIYEIWGHPNSGGGGPGLAPASPSLSWQDARIAAAALTPPPGFGPGHLATISNAAEWGFIGIRFADNGPYIGFTDEVTEGLWRWIDDTPGIWQDPDNFAQPIQTAFTVWGPDLQPNNRQRLPQGENYGMLNRIYPVPTHDYMFDEAGDETRQYLVEWELISVPEPSTLALVALAVAAYCARIIARATRFGS